MSLFPIYKNGHFKGPVGRFFLRHRLRWWSFRNWRAGYAWDPVERFRCCDHTTPYHYQNCSASAPAPTPSPESKESPR